jgi:hypothetical protein
VGRGTLVLLGPEVTFRGQPHGTFKFLFNGIYLGAFGAGVANGLQTERPLGGRISRIGRIAPRPFITARARP